MDDNKVRLVVLAAIALVLGIALLAVVSFSGVSGPRRASEADDPSRVELAVPAQGEARAPVLVERDVVSGGDAVQDIIFVQVPGGRRVSGVRVTIRSGDRVSEAVTDRGGAIRLDLPAGLVGLEARDPGLGTRSLSVASTAGADVVLLELRPWARILARVMDERDSPVSGAIVAATVRGVAGDAQGKPLNPAEHSKSGPDGLAELEVSPDGVYYVAATDSEGRVSPATLVRVTSGSASRVELRLGEPTYTLAGRVLHEGVAVPGARIAVSGAGEFIASPFNAKVVSSDDGSYSVDLKGPGEYRVTVLATGYVGAASHFRVDAANRHAHRDIDVHASEPLAGVVLCQGRGVSGLTLEAVPLDSAGWGVDVFRAMDIGSADGLGMSHRWRMNAETDSSGEFEFSSPPPLFGKWRVAIVGRARVGGHVGAIDVTCEPDASNRGRLVLEASQVRERYSLRVECATSVVGVVEKARFVRGMWTEWKEVMPFSGAHELSIRGEDLGDAFRWDSGGGDGALLYGPRLLSALDKGRMQLAPLPGYVVDVDDVRGLALQMLVVRSDFMHVSKPMRNVRGGDAVRIVEPPGDYVITLLEGSNILDRRVVSLSPEVDGRITLSSSQR